MTITEVKFRRFINEGKLRAVVSLTFDGSFAVHDIKIVQGEERLLWLCPAAVMITGFSVISFTPSTASFAMR